MLSFDRLLWILLAPPSAVPYPDDRSEMNTNQDPHYVRLQNIKLNILLPFTIVTKGYMSLNTSVIMQGWSKYQLLTR